MPMRFGSYFSKVDPSFDYPYTFNTALRVFALHMKNCMPFNVSIVLIDML
jgi:hypothetical protein